MPPTVNTTVNGEPYTYTPNEWGWGVCAASSPADRLHRSYQVYVDHATGRPVRCTCADFCERRQRRGEACKHMREARRQTLLADRARCLAALSDAGRLAATLAKTDPAAVDAWYYMRDLYAAVRDARNPAAVVYLLETSLPHFAGRARLRNGVYAALNCVKW